VKNTLLIVIVFTWQADVAFALLNLQIHATSNKVEHD
jgi:hypothetical protein